ETVGKGNPRGSLGGRARRRTPQGRDRAAGKDEGGYWRPAVAAGIGLGMMFFRRANLRKRCASSVPSPLVGEGQGGERLQLPSLTSTLHPNPPSQGGREK